MGWILKYRALLAVILVAGVSGCSTIGGWFNFGSSAPKIKPAELVQFKETATLTRMWDVDVGKSGPYRFSPADDGSAVYSASESGQIVKLDPANGQVLWRIDAGKKLSAGVGVGAGLVLVGTPKGGLLAFYSDDGKPAWSVTLSGEILVPPVVGGGMVAVRSNDGNVWLLDAKDGKQRWVYNRALPALILREPGHLLLTERALFVGYPGGMLVALALNNGAPLWETSVAVPKGATELERISDVTGPLVATDNEVCAVAYQGRIGCFDQSNGNPVWVRNFSGLTGVALGNHYLFATDEHGMVQGYGLTTGATPWQQEKLRDRNLTTPVAVGKYLAVADYQGYVHLLNQEDGAMAARAATDGSAVTGQILPLRGGLVVQTEKGGVYAFRIQ